MGFKHKIRKSRFVLSCIFLTGYAAYAVYALYYYLNWHSALGVVLLCLIGTALLLSATVTFISYRINLKNAPRPKLHRFIKMAKYAVQLICSGISVGFVLSAVHSETTFSLVMAIISVPFLLWSLFVNVIAEFYDRKISPTLARRRYVPMTPRSDTGEEIDLDRAIAGADGQRPWRMPDMRPRRTNGTEGAAAADKKPACGDAGGAPAETVSPSDPAETANAFAETAGASDPAEPAGASGTDGAPLAGTADEAGAPPTLPPNS